MRKLRIAVMFDSHLPTHGGSFSLISSIVEGFGNTSEDDEFQVILVSVGKSKNLFANCHFAPESRVFKFIRKRLSSKSVRIRAYWQTRTKLARFLLKNKFDLVFFLGVEAEVTSVPFVVTVWDLQHRTHPWFPEVGNERAWQGREEYHKRILPRAIGVITGTQRGKDEILRFYGVEERNVFIIPHVVSTIFHNTSVDVSTRRTGPYLYPAQFWAHKNHHLIVEAVRVLRDKYGKQIYVDFIGSDKGNLDFIKSLVLDFQLQDQVKILGFVPDETKYKLYSESKGLIYASFSGPENLPPLEAFEFGIPVLYPDFPGAREQLDNLPFYFDPNVPLSLIEAIEQVENISPNDLVKRLDAQKEFLHDKRPRDYALEFNNVIVKLSGMIRSWHVDDFQKYL